jgi:3-oxoacyl-[acyl-carrier protein] reductase
MSGPLEGKIALVTGAGGGIGHAIAIALAAAGADVAIHDREMSTALAAEVEEIERLGRRALAVTGDVRDENTVGAFVAQAMATDLRNQPHRILSLLTRGREAHVGKEDRLNRQRGLAAGVSRRRWARSLQRRKGGRSWIDQSRGEGTSRVEIRLNAIAPGPVETKMIEPYKKVDRINANLAASMLKLFGRPEEVADTVVFLVSDAASLYIGQTLSTNGGGVMA